jgi:hypothetical protein
LAGEEGAAVAEEEAGPDKVRVSPHFQEDTGDSGKVLYILKYIRIYYE